MMFLAEAALGEEHTITVDDYTLHAAPKGYDSIVARGSTGPDTKKDVDIELDGNLVAVPQSAAIPQSKFSDSRFDKSEFLLYKESQHRIRYMIKFEWSEHTTAAGTQHSVGQRTRSCTEQVMPVDLLDTRSPHALFCLMCGCRLRTPIEGTKRRPRSHALASSLLLSAVLNQHTRVSFSPSP